jgi:hypothetical protein
VRIGSRQAASLRTGLVFAGARSGVPRLLAEGMVLGAAGSPRPVRCAVRYEGTRRN